MLYLQCWEELCSISCPLKQMYSLHSSTRNEYGGCMDTKQRRSWDRQHINPSTTKNYIRHLGVISGSTHWSVIFSDACSCVILWQIHQLFTVPHLNSWFFPQGINILASGQEWLKNKELRLEVVFTLCGLRTNLEDVNIYEHVCVNVSERYPGQGRRQLCWIHHWYIRKDESKHIIGETYFFLEHSDILGMRF